MTEFLDYVLFGVLFALGWQLSKYMRTKSNIKVTECTRVNDRVITMHYEGPPEGLAMIVQDAVTIAASIDTTTVEGHNLRALLLRLLDGESLRQEVLERAEALELVDAEHACALTSLGREVAELLRPKPWQVTTDRGFPRLLHPNGDFAFQAAGELDLCHRIATLLDADDEREVKRYKATP
jgi:hypothetical protein